MTKIFRYMHVKERVSNHDVFPQFPTANTISMGYGDLSLCRNHKIQLALAIVHTSSIDKILEILRDRILDWREGTKEKRLEYPLYGRLTIREATLS